MLGHNWHPKSGPVPDAPPGQSSECSELPFDCCAHCLGCCGPFLEVLCTVMYRHLTAVRRHLSAVRRRLIVAYSRLAARGQVLFDSCGASFRCSGPPLDCCAPLLDCCAPVGRVGLGGVWWAFACVCRWGFLGLTVGEEAWSWSAWMRWRWRCGCRVVAVWHCSVVDGSGWGFAVWAFAVLGVW